MKRKVIIFGAVIFAVLIYISGSQLAGWYQESRQTRMEFVRIAELVDRSAGNGYSPGVSGSAEAETEAAVEDVEEPGGEPEILKEYLPVYGVNPDFAGWIKIEGTDVDYPVMLTPDDPDFYLDHGFEKDYSGYGVPYIQENCDILSSDNIIIYGHHMRDGSMFTDIHMYMYKDFYLQHKTIYFDTLYSRGTYEVIAAFKTTGNDYGFPYHRFVEAQSEQQFNDYVSKCKELSLYEIEASAQYGDKLITLSTCDYSRRDGRMVVVAKQITDAE